jgi:hypothetical protein
MLRQFLFLKIEQVSAVVAYYHTKHPFRKPVYKKHKRCPPIVILSLFKKAAHLPLELT